MQLSVLGECVHLVLVNIRDQRLPWNSVVRVTDRLDLTVAVYRGGKAVKQQQQSMFEYVSTPINPWWLVIIHKFKVFLIIRSVFFPLLIDFIILFGNGTTLENFVRRFSLYPSL